MALFKGTGLALCALLTLGARARAADTRADFDGGSAAGAWPSDWPHWQPKPVQAAARLWTSDVSACVATAGGRRFRCSLGKNGVSADKREGDGTTPIGTFRLLAIFYRGNPPATAGLQAVPLQPDWGWCEDDQRFPAAYNRLVLMPHPCVRFGMWRTDELYDLIVVVDYNHPKIYVNDRDPEQPVPGKGSAIFIHLSTKDSAGAYDYTGTAGCISFAREDLLAILRQLGPKATVTVGANRVVTFSN